MSKIAKIQEQSLSVVIASIPNWIRDFKKTHTRHYREGQADFVIQSSPIRIDEKQHQEAKKKLEQLLFLVSVPVSMNRLINTLKLINISVANPITEKDFSFKAQAIFNVFKNYPNCIFDQETAKKLATFNTFFPSANEIKQVLDQAKSELDSEIVNLKSIVGYDFYTKEDQVREQMELQEKRRKILQAKADQERQYRINHLQAITKPLDDLNKVIQEAMENYMPANPMEMNSPELIKVFTEQMNQIDDQQIKSILQDKINTICSAARQIEELRKLGVVVKPIKQGAIA